MVYLNVTNENEATLNGIQPLMQQMRELAIDHHYVCINTSAKFADIVLENLMAFEKSYFWQSPEDIKLDCIHLHTLTTHQSRETKPQFSYFYIFIVFCFLFVIFCLLIQTMCLLIETVFL